jgi:hypothetical protein
MASTTRFRGTPVYGNDFPDTGCPKKWDCIPRYWGFPIKKNTVPDIEASPYMGMHYMTLGYLNNWESIP